jgi:hypothetical protein
MPGMTMDAGGPIALDRNDRRLVVLLARARETGARATVPATILAQAIRKPDRLASVGCLRICLPAMTTVCAAIRCRGAWRPGGRRAPGVRGVPLLRTPRTLPRVLSPLEVDARPEPLIDLRFFGSPPFHAPPPRGHVRRPARPASGWLRRRLAGLRGEMHGAGG